ncbi:MAG TPA: ABC transporter permease [Phycisphaerae bacterium]|nr:ABC transporter permease [Phycisphaerae bacterium]HRY67991.1 ABC transporter permease [Phycisphaerae bacterium]HSA26728.1 ABC transporter permease [Phycisphaerae bacterium]
MPAIALHNLIHDKHKLVLALVGIMFSVVLITLQLGILTNATHNAGGLVNNAGADVWVMQCGTRNVDQCETLSERRYYQVITVPGVAWAERLVVQFSPWKLPNGQQSTVTLVGLEPDSRLNLPWGMAVGQRDDIFHQNGIIIDKRERSRYGSAERPLSVDDRLEIGGHRARVAGFSSGVGTFTFAPYVFTSYKRAQESGKLRPDSTKYVLVKALPGLSAEELRDRILQRVNEVDAFTTTEFAAKTSYYWLISTGMGLGVIAAATISLIVGTVIVGQTMYSATIERLHEYGTLKALGMSNIALAGVVVRQAIMTGLIGYAGGAAIAYSVGNRLSQYNVPVEVPLALLAVMLVVAVGMCVVASVSSVVRVFRLEPAIVFRN